MKYDYLKVLLYGYPKMEALADSVKEGARVRARLSFRNYGDVLALAESIAEEMVVCERLQAWKQALESCLSAASDEQLFLLEYKYFRRKRMLKGKFCNREVNYSERSYFRKQNELLHSIAAHLAIAGYTEKLFFDDFGTFAPFMRVYAALTAGRERKIMEKRKNRSVTFRQNSAGSGGAGTRLPRNTMNATARTANATAQMSVICRAESGCAVTGSSVGGVGCGGVDVSVR